MSDIAILRAITGPAETDVASVARELRVVTDPVLPRIMTELQAIEQSHDVSILVAIEACSRGWLFPSLDSDYDVRFIYRHKRHRYFSVEPLAEGIDPPRKGVLDLAGWDLRKTLQLLACSNATLLEWLTSPVRYIDNDPVRTALLALAQESADLPALTRHYRRAARHSYEKLTWSARARFKTYCYALRAALAVRWLRSRNAPPPMDLLCLLDGVGVDLELYGAIIDLVARKAVSEEDDAIERMPLLDAFISDTLADPAPALPTVEGPVDFRRADGLLRAILEDRVI